MPNPYYLRTILLVVFLCSITPFELCGSNQNDGASLTLQVAHYMNLGLELSKKKEFEKAIKAYTEALQFPENSLTYMLFLNRGASYLNLGKHKAALNDIHQGISREPLNPLGYQAQSYVYWETKEMDKVIMSMTKALRLGLRTGRDFYMRGVAYAEVGEYHKGIADLTTALELGFTVPETYHDRGYFYEQLGLYDKALKDFSTSLKIDPGNPIGLIRRAAVFRCVGNYQKAINDYSEILNDDPLNVEARLQRAETFHEMADYPSAYQDLQFGLNNQFNHPYWALILAKVQFRLGNLSEALKINAQARKSDNQDVQVAGAFQRGFFLLNQGQIILAQEAYELGIKFTKKTKTLDRLNEAIALLSRSTFKEKQRKEAKENILNELKRVNVNSDKNPKKYTHWCKIKKDTL